MVSLLQTPLVAWLASIFFFHFPFSFYQMVLALHREIGLGVGGFFSSGIMNSLIYFELLKWLHFQDLECLINAFLLNGLQHKASKTDAISCVCLFNH